MSVKSIADQLSQTQEKADVLHSRALDFCMLTKPRVMVLAVFTALVGLVIAPGTMRPLDAFVAVLAIAAGAGAAGVLNMWYDADIDAVMARTALRPIPSGTVSPAEALLFGAVLAVAAIVVLGLATNFAAAALLACAILFYVIVYTAWLKRLTPQNIVIGGVAGALPPVIGWAAATGQIGLEPLVLFLIIFLWTPPHFWALALNRTDEYARAGVPMLPVISGRAVTTRQILVYCVLVGVTSMLPLMLGFAGPIYGAAAVACGANLVALAIQLRKSDEADRRAPRRLFAFSIFYLFALFAALLIDHADQPLRSAPASSSRTDAGTVHAKAPRTVRVAGASVITGTDEVCNAA